MAGTAKTMFEKIWAAHVIADLGDGFDLLHIDRLINNEHGAQGYLELARLGAEAANPELQFVTPDHGIANHPEAEDPLALNSKIINNVRAAAEKYYFTLFDLGRPGHGIAHVIGPELGIALPGATLVCGDSHTCTNGAVGALAWGIGSSEVIHVAATQTTVQTKPKTMRVNFSGKRPRWVTAKDMILHLVGTHRASGGIGYAIEFAGPAIRDLPMEGRFTICNMTIEFGTNYGTIAPDETTIEYVKGRKYAPSGALWEQALENWAALPSDAGAAFDEEIDLDVGAIAPHVTWGTSPEHVIPIDGQIPDPALEKDPVRRQSLEDALAYQDLEPGQALAGLPVQWAFIGSCTNGRLGDLRAAADVLRGRKVAPGVNALVTPGSFNVKIQAEEEGLARIFTEAGFVWGNPGCSLCGTASPDRKVGIGERSISATNRNMIGRQGPSSRTHLASPEMVAAAAISGRITDIRDL